MSYPLPPPPQGIEDDAWAAAVAEVRGYCGWHIAPDITETLTVDGPGGSVLVLPTLNLVDLVSITNDGTDVTDPEWSRSGMVRHYCWTRKFRGVVAEITHGYEDWPEDLVAVMGEVASSAALVGVKSVTSGPHSFTLETSSSLRPSLLEVLGRYQLPFVA